VISLTTAIETPRPILDERSVVPYLVGAKLLDSSVAAKRLTVSWRGSRNPSFAVAAPNGHGLFVKQAAMAQDLPTVEREVVVRSHLERWGDANVEPGSLRFHDARAGIIVIDLIPHAESLWDRSWSGGPPGVDISASLGRALADLHALSPPPVPPRRPWGLAAHRPRPDSLRHLSVADLALLRALQGDRPLREGLDRLTQEWRPGACTHGDVRWENVVISRLNPRRTMLVDWDRGGPGDARADVGYALAEYLRRWIDSMPMHGRLDPIHAGAHAELGLKSMQPAIAALWRVYAERRALDPVARRQLLRDAMRFAAARLVEVAFEITADELDLDGHAVLALQLGANVLARPQRAASDLLGLDLAAP
jgi:hypothetical protein